MEETGYVGENMANVLHTINSQLPEKDNESFAHLKDDALRVGFMLKRDLIHDSLIFHATHELKSPTKAKQLREDGNKLFQKKEYKESIKLYTASVMQAPTELTFEECMDKEGEDSGLEQGAQLPLAFANRSAALYHLQRYDLCIRDVDQAIKSGYPKDLIYKLYDRKGKCHLKLKNKWQAVESFQCAQNSLTEVKLDEKTLQIWRTNLEKQLRQCDGIYDDVKPTTEEEFVAPRVKAPHEKYSKMSGKACVKYNDKVGRHLRANVNLTVGDLIISEKPFESILLEDYYDKHCYYCLKAVIVSVPDHQCSNIQYCSDTCRQTAWDRHHNTEYKFLNLLGKNWCGTIGHLVFRIVRKAGLRYLVEFLEENKDKVPDYENGVYNSEGVYDEGFYSIYNMVTNIKERVPEGLSDFTVFAVYLTKLLQLSGFFDEDEESRNTETRYSKNLVTIGGLVMRLLQIVQVNCRGVVKLQLPTDFEDPRPVEIGMALYATTALLNHSCEPSAVAVFYGHDIIIKAVRNISKGKEISIDYGMLFYRNVLSQRRMNLSLRYSFQCNCPACVKNWPLWRDLHQNYPNWKCEECEAELNAIRTMSDSLVRCDRCSHSQDLEECMKKLSVSHDVYSKAMEEALAGNVGFALEGIQGHLSLCQRFLQAPWRDLVVAQAAVRQCFRLQGNVRLL